MHLLHANTCILELTMYFEHNCKYVIVLSLSQPPRHSAENRIPGKVIHSLYYQISTGIRQQPGSIVPVTIHAMIYSMLESLIKEGAASIKYYQH